MNLYAPVVTNFFPFFSSGKEIDPQTYNEIVRIIATTKEIFEAASEIGICGMLIMFHLTINSRRNERIITTIPAIKQLGPEPKNLAYAPINT